MHPKEAYLSEENSPCLTFEQGLFDVRKTPVCKKKKQVFFVLPLTFRTFAPAKRIIS